MPFDTKEFNLTDYLTIARENFIGRRWLYQEIESAFHPPRQGVSGVLIIGDPGAGKSALTAQLICSRTSSRTIHDHVLGYHLCKHSDGNTQNGGKFVRNLADMVARRLPEYGYIVANNSYIQRSLNTDCVALDDPVGCFEQAILTPLRLLKTEPKENWYIVIDSLDECLSQSKTSHSIVYLLNKKLTRFPSWLKLVMTSRNQSFALMNSNSIIKLAIDPGDSRNTDDIELFLSTKFYQDSPLIHQIKFWFGDNTIKNTARLIAALLNKSQGNFLFVKEMLHHWETFRAQKSNPYALPETLGEIYHSYFERHYSRPEQFKPIRRVLELLVASFQPLSEKDIFNILRMKEVDLEEEYEFKDRMKELGHFLRYGENNTVTLYHLSLTEWLTSESNRKSPYYVSKKKGHENFCDYYFSLITADENKPSLRQSILNLAQHIALGGWRKAYVKEFLRFPSQVVNSSDSRSNRTLLHFAATINNTDVLELLLRHFSYTDCVDNRGITPAFLAAEHGLVHNLALMVHKGANVNHKTKSLPYCFISQGYNCSEFDTDWNFTCTPVLQCKTEFCSSTMLHAAAHRGHLEVVNFLLDNGANVLTVNGVHLTAMHIAAEEGHLKVVKALYEAGAAPDQTALHHAAGRNRSDVVKYLLQIGITDKCMRCDGSFYWLKTEKRFKKEVHPNKIVCELKKLILSNSTMRCPTRVSIVKHISVKKKNFTNCKGGGVLYDDKHLIFCETALHAAVSAGHEAVVRELVSKPKHALACQDYSGRTPLHEAVRKNHNEIVKLLLIKQPKLVHQNCNNLQSFHEQGDTVATTSSPLSMEEETEYHKDICHCGYTPLHLAARYGHWDIGLDLIRGGANVDATDCLGATPLHVAACHNHKDFVDILAHSKTGANVNRKSFNGSTPLHSAAACGAVDVIDHLLYFGANLTTVDKNNLSALHYSIMNIRQLDFDHEVFLNRTNLSDATLHLSIDDRRGYLADFYSSDYNSSIIQNTNHYLWLDTFSHLIIRGSDINAVDIYGRTPLHFASANGLADAVNILLQRKAELEICDRSGRTPLEVAVENSTVGLVTAPTIIAERFHDLKPHLGHYEMVVYLLLSSGASFKNCSRNAESLLHHALARNQPNIAQLLLLKGASIHCEDSFGRTPVAVLVANGGVWAQILFKHINVINNSNTIQCGEPFRTSVFHLLCFFTPKREGNNFFQPQRCENETCSCMKSHLERAIENHRLKFKVIDSCLDAEGFTPLHRAAQGANLLAVRALLKLGANISLLSPLGHDALTLAVLHSGGNTWQHLVENDKLLARKDNASVVALELLHHAMKSRGFRIVCDPTKTELTLYHLAASRGLVKFIQQIFKEKDRHQLDVNCPNKDGITPLYLAKLFNFKFKDDRNNPWKEVIKIIKDRGGKIMYPSKDVEINVVYRRLFGWIPNDLELNVRPDVRGFVSGLLSTYLNKQNTPLYCNVSSLNTGGMEIGDPLSLSSIWNELLLQLKPLKEIGHSHPSVVPLVSLALKELEMCAFLRKRSIISFKKFVTSWRSLNFSNFNSLQRSAVMVSESNYRLLLMRTPVKLFYFMRSWHQEVFQRFSCVKTLVFRYRTFFLNENRLAQLIAQYEESTPSRELKRICFSLQHVFQFYILSHLTKSSYTKYGIFYHRFPAFVTKRMGWVDGQLSTDSGSWPLPFIIKFSLGLYPEYDYLKVLNVGLELITYIEPYTNELSETVAKFLKLKEMTRYISLDVLLGTLTP